MPGSGPSRRPRSPCTFAQRLREQILTSLLGHNHGLCPHPSPAGCSPRRCRLHLIPPSATEAPARQLCSPKPLGLPQTPGTPPTLPTRALSQSPEPCGGMHSLGLLCKKLKVWLHPALCRWSFGADAATFPPRTGMSATAGSCLCPQPPPLPDSVCVRCAGQERGVWGGACACVHECACALQLGGHGGAQGPGRAALLLLAPGG